MASNFPAGDLLDAIDFAASKHKFQKRKGDNSPYINVPIMENLTKQHPIGVANILAKEGGVTDVTTLIGAVLHEYYFSEFNTKYC